MRDLRRELCERVLEQPSGQRVADRGQHGPRDVLRALLVEAELFGDRTGDLRATERLRRLFAVRAPSGRGRPGASRAVRR
ncbi:MAG: hypothetical protein M5U28_22050 [Sandaracinaceae bacterium]|nr:hypothetical protein [Sandaracinaceae bacterium]